jgi:prepilin-type N-terminal cleavage/methylation domain-containing protein
MSTARRAFTLIEMLLVVSIIALLISILLPSIRQAKENAITAVCKSRLNQLFNGHAHYSFDNTGQFPHYNNWLWLGPQSTATSAQWVEYGNIWPYVKNREMYFCPKDDRRRDPGTLAIGNKSGNGDAPIHTYVRTFEPHDRYAAKLKSSGISPSEADTRANYLRPKVIRPGMLMPIGGSTLPASAYATGPSGPQDLALLFEEASANTDVVGPDTSWALLNDGYSFFSGVQDMMTQRHKGMDRGNGHVMYWDGHCVLVNSVKFNDWPLDHNPYAESVVFGVPIP